MQRFGIVDWSIICVYLGGTFIIFTHFARKKKDLQDFLLAGRKMHWFPLAISILAAGVSAVSMLGNPTYIFRYNLQQSVPILILSVPLMTFVGLTMIPTLYVLRSYTIYEYLERRFHRHIRTVVSFMQILTKLSWVATIIYVPSLIISTISGMPAWLSIFLIGGIAIIYTTFGGYEGVIWADIVHFSAIMVGLIAVCTVVIIHFDGNIVSMWREAEASGSTRMFDFSFDFTREMTFWAVLTSMTLSTIVMFGTDQMIVQKCFAAKDLKTSIWSMVGNSIIGLPFSTLLIILGLGVAAYFHANPQAYQSLLATDPNQSTALDKAIPYFVLTKVPIGIAGLFVAAVLAVTISSVNSGITTLATMTLKDLIEKHIKGPWEDGRLSLKLSKFLTVAFGIIATVIALWVGRLGTIIQIFALLYSFIGAPLMSVFLLGLFTKRTNNFGIICALIVGYLTTPIIYRGFGFDWVWLNSVSPFIYRVICHGLGVNWVWLGSIVNFNAMLTGYIASLIYRWIKKDYEYSIYTWRYRG
ncbi:MAG: sodium/solute symporter [Sedimentisphaerales bacterium]|nr:sodium/solute symporter [Sedimentisphaerales bacterium]